MRGRNWDKLMKEIAVNGVLFAGVALTTNSFAPGNRKRRQMCSLGVSATDETRMPNVATPPMGLGIEELIANTPGEHGSQQTNGADTYLSGIRVLRDIGCSLS